MVTLCLGFNSEVHLQIYWLIQLYLSNSWLLFDIRLNLLQSTHEFIWSHPDNLFPHAVPPTKSQCQMCYSPYLPVKCPPNTLGHGMQQAGKCSLKGVRQG